MSEGAVRLAGIALLVAMGVLIVLIADGREIEATTVAIVLIALLAVAAVVAPNEARRALQRISGLNVGGIIEVAFAQEERAQDALKRLPAKEDDFKVGDRPTFKDDPVLEVLAVRRQLQRRLRFVRDDLFRPRPDKQAYDDIVLFLRDRELLYDDEVGVIFYVLGDSVPSWPKSSRDDFLDAAWPLAMRLATETWDRWVRRRLGKAGLLVSELSQSKKHRADFSVEGPGGQFVVAARVADPLDSVDKTVSRWRETPPPASRVIVVPAKRADEAASRVPQDARPGISAMSIAGLIKATQG